MTSSQPPAEAALQLLFKKLHPHLEDAAHALQKGAPKREQERLHIKLISARLKAVEALEAMLEHLEEDDPVAEVLDTLGSNLTPVGENWQQSLTLTQLCLEEAPADLLPHIPSGHVAESAWGPRMVAFLAHLKDPAFQAHARWKDVDEEIGETEEE
jgi:hypothetical protein